MSNSISTGFDNRETGTSLRESTGTQETIQRSWLWVAIVSGIIGFLCFVAVPFLPVHQTQSSVSWPQNESLNSIQTPLISYVPVDFTADIPLRSLNQLNKDQTLVVGTLAQDFVKASERGLFVQVNGDGGLDVISRGNTLLTVDKDILGKLPDDAHLNIKLTETLSTIEVPGARDEDGEPLSVTLSDWDHRPDLMGIYTELADTPQNFQALTDSGLSVQYTIDSRFSTSPTILKTSIAVLGLICLVLALTSLYKFDRLDGHRSKGILPAGWRKITGQDWAVAAILAYWHIFGANTSDDGYILTMAREAQQSGYLANYYRWYGVPEAPFGFPYYNLFEAMTKISTASAWMRLPALISAFIVWFIVSRSLLHKLGSSIAQSSYARWAAAFSFLLLWLPYNNGIRPEPFIATGALLAWACFERAIETSRLLPAALGVFVASIVMGAGPTGLIAVAALLICLLPLLLIVKQRIPLLQRHFSHPPISSKLAATAMLVPFLPTGTAILAGAFGDQTFASVVEAVRVRSIIGPSYNWFNEIERYGWLFDMDSADGSFSRRIGVLILFTYIILLVLTLRQFKNIKGLSYSVIQRLLWILILSIVLLMLTPTKWSHHFGVFAAFIAPIAAVGAISLAIITARSVLKSCIAIGAVLLVFAFSLSGTNGWWYISSWKVPWWDKPIQYHAHLLSNGIFYIVVAILLIGVVYYIVNVLRQKDISSTEDLTETSDISESQSTQDIDSAQYFDRNNKGRALVLSSTIIVTVISLFINMASMGKAFASQYPAYTVALGNLRTFSGNSCQLGEEVMVEANTNDSFLKPIDTTLGESLDALDSVGFGPNSVPSNISAQSVTPQQDDDSHSQVSDINSNVDDGNESSQEEQESVQKKNLESGINGSNLKLPFELDRQKIPVMGSWSSTKQQKSRLTSAWFEIPERREDQPLIVVSVAGTIEHLNKNDVFVSGSRILLEYGTSHDDGSVTNTEELAMEEIAETSKWRNLRLELQDIPESANVVRLKVTDDNLDPENWIAVTPPRVPTLKPLNTVFSQDDPALLDWLTAFQFPCYKPLGHYAGVAEVARFRVTPGILDKDYHAPFQSDVGGGLMGVVDTVNTVRELPSYLNKDWKRDWGTVEVYRRRTNSLDVTPNPGEIDYQEMTRSGLWSTGHMKINESSPRL